MEGQVWGTQVDGRILESRQGDVTGRAEAGEIARGGKMLIGAGISRVGKLGASVAQLAAEALDAALRDAGGLARAELNGLV